MIDAAGAEKIIGAAITFDDVLLVPLRSEILPRDVDVRTQLTICMTDKYISQSMRLFSC